ncbi:folate-binding protein [Synechococcus sp. J7-Johnson]|uniref:CAF17-like 4Fe-4S cluster assembly/insertion protein YgfZ n=1 Tax=Synechococcus sp. J7-Johnson TaxID=2823737 RepID=UPI0020CFCE43|nr:folate-binding protein [Synechococcus sp. J7-Johnson]MCP9839240.1 folate-binding protein [Synechococcus sp. J7-Johnson]
MDLNRSTPLGPWDWRPASPSRWDQPVSLIRLEGPDSLRFLHGQSSQDLERAQPGQCLATCCLTPTARVRGLAEVLVDASGAWLVITAGEGAAIHQALDRVLFPADQVNLGPLLSGTLISLEGAAGAIQDTSVGWRLPGDRLVLMDGEYLTAELEAIPALGPIESERWRLSQGRPLAPNEISEEVNPFELGLADRVSLSKGCYVGQETLAKLATYDGVKQQLRRWCWAEPAASTARTDAEPVVGTVLRTFSGERAGRITSSLRLNAGPDGTSLWLGLALVRRQALAEPLLLAGEGITLEISEPMGVVAPPVGAGSAAS